MKSENKRRSGLRLMPAANKKTGILILGSFPGEASLNAGQYYAHRRNYFWRIISDVFNVAIPKTYDGKKVLLRRHNICVWDVVGSCRRSGSLDSDIRDPEMNRIDKLIISCPNIKAVFLNGNKAAGYFGRYFKRFARNVNIYALPSTSPANAATSYSMKLKLWKKILDYV